MAASRTVRAIGPSVESPSILSRVGTRPMDGLMPTAPHNDAGTRIEPPPSDPQATGPTPETTAAAAPPDEPPEACPGRHGVLVDPVNMLSVTPRSPNSGVVVLPRRITPCSFNRPHPMASRSGT